MFMSMTTHSVYMYITKLGCGLGTRLQLRGQVQYFDDANILGWYIVLHHSTTYETLGILCHVSYTTCKPISKDKILLSYV